MLGSLLRAASTLLRKRVREPEAAEPPRPAKRPAVEHAEVPGGAAWDCGYLASTHGRARATCRAPPRGTWALLPADLVLQLSSLLPLAVRTRSERWGWLSCACCRTRALKARRAGPLGAAAGVRAVCRRRHFLRPAAAHTSARAARARAAAAGRAAGGEKARLCAGRLRPPGEARVQAHSEGAGLWGGPGRAAVRLPPCCPSLGLTAAARAQTRARGRHTWHR